MHHPRLTGLVELFKWRLSLAIAASASAGYLLRPARDLGVLAWLFAGVFAVAVGCGCLNHYQDRHLDRDFLRTRNRPMPAGRVGEGEALGMAVLLMAAGMAGLVWGPFPVSVGATTALAAFCYNGLYTPLKTRTSFALIPGIACGALPPLIGWFAAGGHLGSLPVWGLMVVFGVWQPPHYWLIMLAHQEDYRRGRIPSMLLIFSRIQIERILFVWVVALAMALLALPLSAGVLSPFLVAVMVVLVALFTALFAYQLFIRAEGPSFRFLFVCVNLAVFLGVALTVLHRFRG